MGNNEQFYRWVQSGKQIGTTSTFRRDGKAFFSAVAIQQIGDQKYRVLVYEIDEELMAAEVFARDELKDFDSLEEAVKFIEQTTPASIADLQPRKGQRWFR
jgi:hypothetical protein